MHTQPQAGAACAGDALAARSGWPLERVLFAMAGTVTLLAAVLAALVSPWFLLLAGFVALNQWAFALTGHCGASFVLTRVFHLKRAIQS